MYVFRKRSKIKQQLAAKKAREINKKLCPGCSTELTFVEATSDRDTFLCSKCDNIISFGKFIDHLQKQTNDKKLNLITIRERPAEQPEHTPQSVENSNKSIDTVRDAMEHLSVISFSYRGSKGGAPTSRSVEPYKLTSNSTGEIILYAYDLEAGSIRIFKLRNSADMQKTEYTFKPRWDVVDKLKKKEKNV